jgi:hypothetical protein
VGGVPGPTSGPLEHGPGGPEGRGPGGMEIVCVCGLPAW